MNIYFIYLTTAIVSISNIYAAPSDSTSYYDVTDEITTTEIVTSTASNARDGLEDNHEWEDFIIGGPMVANYLGLFMVVASRKDQVLKVPVGYQVKYIQSLNSLRAVLTQIATGMHNAFVMSSNELDRAQTSKEHISADLKAVLEHIQLMPKSLLNKFLPNSLRSLGRSVDEAVFLVKPILTRLKSVHPLLEELIIVLNSTIPDAADTNYFDEARSYAKDILDQWSILTSLFEKVSVLADNAQNMVNNNFITPTNSAQQIHGFPTQTDRIKHLEKVIPTAIEIDELSHLLNAMIMTYVEVYRSSMLDQIRNSQQLINLSVELDRIKNQQQFWRSIVSESVKTSRLAQTRHNEFIASGTDRRDEYIGFSQNVIPL